MLGYFTITWMSFVLEFLLFYFYNIILDGVKTESDFHHSAHIKSFLCEEHQGKNTHGCPLSGKRMVQGERIKCSVEGFSFHATTLSRANTRGRQSSEGIWLIFSGKSYLSAIRGLRMRKGRLMGRDRGKCTKPSVWRMAGPSRVPAELAVRHFAIPSP